MLCYLDFIVPISQLAYYNHHKSYKDAVASSSSFKPHVATYPTTYSCQTLHRINIFFHYVFDR